jgi:hypothetical protein
MSFKNAPCMNTGSSGRRQILCHNPPLTHQRQSHTCLSITAPPVFDTNLKRLWLLSGKAGKWVGIQNEKVHIIIVKIYYHNFKL